MFLQEGGGGGGGYRTVLYYLLYVCCIEQIPNIFSGVNKDYPPCFGFLRTPAAMLKAPVRVVLKIGIFEDIFNNRVRTPVRVVLKTVFFEDIFKTARNRFEERRYLQTDSGRFEE